MGRRRQRKRERRTEARWREPEMLAATSWPVTAFDPFAIDPYEPVPARFRDGYEAVATVTTPVCGRCREFVPNAELGRGECLHPGSGVLRPWDDTPACSFYSQRRGA